MDRQERTYLIPVNVPTRFEFFSGIGFKEIMYIGITLVVAIIIRFIAVQFGAGFGMSMIIIIVPPVFVGMMFSRSADGSSVARTITAIRTFSKSQKKYFYKLKG